MSKMPRNIEISMQIEKSAAHKLSTNATGTVTSARTVLTNLLKDAEIKSSEFWNNYGGAGRRDGNDLYRDIARKFIIDCRSLRFRWNEIAEVLRVKSGSGAAKHLGVYDEAQAAYDDNLIVTGAPK